MKKKYDYVVALDKAHGEHPDVTKRILRKLVREAVMAVPYQQREPRFYKDDCGPTQAELAEAIAKELIP